jgi:hypothetical protein
MQNNVKKATSSNRRLSLKENYAIKSFLNEKRRLNEERLLAESYAVLILEELDKNQMQQATNAIKKFQLISNAAGKANMGGLQKVIKNAAEDINQFMGGGLGALLKKGIGALASKMGVKIAENPLLKGLTLLNSLESAFAALPDILSNNIENYDEKAKESPLDQAGDDKAKKAIFDTFKKALVPEGVFSKIISLVGKGGSLPYMGDIKLVINDILLAPASAVTELIAATQTAPMTSDIQKAVSSIAQAGQEAGQQGGGAGGGAEVAVPKLGAPVTGTAQLAAVVAAGSAKNNNKDVQAAVDDAQKNPKAVIDKFMNYVAQKSKQDVEKVVKPVITALIKNKALETNVKLESVRSNQVVLTSSDIAKAKKALIQSRGSVKEWIRIISRNALLVENAMTDIKKAIDSGEIKTTDELEEKLKDEQLSDAIKGRLRDIFKKKNSGAVGDKAADDKPDPITDNLKAAATYPEGTKIPPVEISKNMDQLVLAVERGRIPDAQTLTKHLDSLTKEKPNFAKAALPQIKKVFGVQQPAEVSKVDWKKYGEEEAAPGSGKPGDDKGTDKKDADKGAGQEPSAAADPKRAAVIKKIENDIKDIKADQVSAVLDAIPDFLMAESYLRNRLGIII